eukprot:889354-Prymnesium_polylepis.2
MATPGSRMVDWPGQSKNSANKQLNEARSRFELGGAHPLAPQAKSVNVPQVQGGRGGSVNHLFRVMDRWATIKGLNTSAMGSL